MNTDNPIEFQVNTVIPTEEKIAIVVMVVIVGIVIVAASSIAKSLRS